MLLGLAMSVAAQAVDDGGGSGANIQVLNTDSLIVFNTSPRDTGWVEAQTTGGELDTVSITVQTDAAVIATYNLGGDLHHLGHDSQIPLQFAVRASGTGAFVLSGQSFSTPGFTPWQLWEDASDASPMMGWVSFEPNQVFSMEFEARAMRNGLSDLGGDYDQPQPLTVTIAPLNP